MIARVDNKSKIFNTISSLIYNYLFYYYALLDNEYLL